MRMMLKVTLPVESANKAIRDGSLPKLLQSTLEELKAEAAYFYPEDGKRAAHIFFDMRDVTQIPAIAEPFFMQLNAAVEFVPVMNADDLRAGLDKASRKG